MNLLSEQSCSSYKPEARPVARTTPPAVPLVQQKPRFIGKMQKASKLAAVMSRMKNEKRFD